MITIYGLANCDSCRKLRKQLDGDGQPYRFVDLRKVGADPADVKSWISAVGRDRLINRRGTTWRGLDPDQKALIDGDNPVDGLCAHPAIIKRPVVDFSGHLTVGLADALRVAAGLDGSHSSS